MWLALIFFVQMNGDQPAIGDVMAAQILFPSEETCIQSVNAAMPELKWQEGEAQGIEYKTYGSCVQLGTDEKAPVKAPEPVPDTQKSL